jgi:hypothetical protein
MPRDGFSLISIPHYLDEVLIRRVKGLPFVNANELLEKYQTLLAENQSLREENETLKVRLGITDPPRSPPQSPENHLPLAFPPHESPGETEKGALRSMRRFLVEAGVKP